MRLSTSSFDLSEIAKVAGAAIATILLAWIIVPDHLPFDEQSVHGAATLNELIAEQYVYEYPAKRVVLLGSSILTMIPPANCRPDDVASIYLQGRSAMTGLEVARRVGARPEVAFVETTTLAIGVDQKIIDTVFRPLYWRISSVIAPLRHNRNWIVLWYRWKLYQRTPPRYDIEVPTQSVSEWNEQTAHRIAPLLRDRNNDGAITRMIPELTTRVRELQRQGTRVYFFDPIDPRLRVRSPDKDILARIREAFPDVEILEPPDATIPFYRWDGLHFHNASGLRFFNYLLDHAGIKAPSKCELVTVSADPLPKFDRALVPTLGAGQSIGFQDEKSRAALLSGWSSTEPWGVWSNGSVSQTVFRLRETMSGGAVVRATVQPYLAGGAILQQRVEISVLGGGRSTVVLDTPEPRIVDILLAQTQLAKDTDIVIEWRFPDAVSPRKAIGSNDNRSLGMGIVSLALVEK